MQLCSSVVNEKPRGSSHNSDWERITIYNTVIINKPSSEWRNAMPPTLYTRVRHCKSVLPSVIYFRFCFIFAISIDSISTLTKYKGSKLVKVL